MSIVRVIRELHHQGHKMSAIFYRLPRKTCQIIKTYPWICMLTSFNQSRRKVWKYEGQLVIQGLLKGKVLFLFLSKSEGQLKLNLQKKVFFQKHISFPENFCWYKSWNLKKLSPPSIQLLKLIYINSKSGLSFFDFQLFY